MVSVGSRKVKVWNDFFAYLVVFCVGVVEWEGRFFVFSLIFL